VIFATSIDYRQSKLPSISAHAAQFTAKPLRAIGFRRSGRRSRASVEGRP